MKKAFSNPLVAIGAIFLVMLVLFATFGPAVRTAQLRPAGKENFTAVYNPIDKPLKQMGETVGIGTDDQGRDIIARLAQGARVSLSVGFIVQGISIFVGLGVGVIGVFAPTWIRQPILRLTDAMFAFPDILLAILIVGIMRGSGLGILPVIVALSITGWPALARLTVTQIASVKDREFVVAARASGASTIYLVFKHILPQILPLVLAVSMIELAGNILAESTLSYLGIGVQVPDPSWGNMINNARGADITANFILLFSPCLILSLTIFALNFVGDGIRVALDPKNS